MEGATSVVAFLLIVGEVRQCCRKLHSGGVENFIQETKFEHNENLNVRKN